MGDFSLQKSALVEGATYVMSYGVLHVVFWLTRGSLLVLNIAGQYWSCS